MRNRLLNAWILLVLIGQTTLVIPESLSDGTPQIPVISSSTPEYPPLAALTHIKGTVLVDLIIDSDGKVISAKAVEGHPLLRNSAEVAATLWRFRAVSSGINYRKARLTFVFNIVFDESTETKDEGLFIPPFGFEVTRKIATIAPLSRVAGRLPEERCPLHGEELKLDIVPITYGLLLAKIGYNNVDVVSLLHNVWNKLTYRESYFDAARVKFPNSRMHAYGGCMVGYGRKAEVLYCQRCREVEAKWRKKHPGRGPEIAAVISGGNGQ